MVEAQYFFCACLEALFYDEPHEVRVRVGADFRRLVPADVWLDDDRVALFHETPHAAHFGDSALEHFSGRSAEYRGDVEGFLVIVFSFGEKFS